MTPLIFSLIIITTLAQSSLEDNSFRDISNLFIDSYGAFKTKLINSGIVKESSSKQVFITFGISGAGKSTLLLRLVENSEPQEFYDKMRHQDQSSKDTLIKIGKDCNSMTIIPEAFRVGDSFFCDMPGFSETEQSKKVVVSILQKCLLNKVRAVKFLVVVDVARIMFDEKPTTLVNSYVDSFKDLVSDDFLACLKNSYFILTHNDKFNHTSKDVKSQIGEVILNYRGSEMVGYFLKRLYDYHMLLDYRFQSKSQIVDEINKLVERDKGGRDSAIINPNWRMDNLKIGEEILSVKCNLEVSRLVEESTGFTEKVKVRMSNLSDKMEEIVRFTNNWEINLSNIHDHKSKTKDSLDHFNSLSESNPFKIKEVEAELSSISSKREIIKQKWEFYRRENVDMRITTIRVDLSETSWPIPYYESVSLSVELHVKNFKDVRILIIKSENERDLLKLFKGKFIPPENFTPQDLRIPGVLFDSENLNLCSFKMIMEDSAIRITAHHRDPFKVLIYSKSDLSESLSINDIEYQFLSEIDNLKSREDYLKDELTRLIDELKSSKDSTIRFSQQLVTIDNQLSNHRESMLESLSSLHSLLVESEKGYLSLIKEGEQISKSESLSHLKSIRDILLENDFSCAWSDSLDKIRSVVDSQTSKIEGSIKNLRLWHQQQSKRSETLLLSCHR
jgi:GTP-binding protein EngB required for normal cell division/predicted  nucleic acid-binding Zn-ribbon protein